MWQGEGMSLALSNFSCPISRRVCWQVSSPGLQNPMPCDIGDTSSQQLPEVCRSLVPMACTTKGTKEKRLLDEAPGEMLPQPHQANKKDSKPWTNKVLSPAKWCHHPGPILPIPAELWKALCVLSLPREVPSPEKGVLQRSQNPCLPDISTRSWGNSKDWPSRCLQQEITRSLRGQRICRILHAYDLWEETPFPYQRQILKPWLLPAPNKSQQKSLRG